LGCKDQIYGKHKYKVGALLLVSGKNRSILGQNHNQYNLGDKDILQVIWAGDIDRDNKLDVITNFQAKNSGGYCVQLSTGAKEGELFGSQECHFGSAC
jgi:hypothetical protein